MVLEDKSNRLGIPPQRVIWYCTVYFIWSLDLNKLSVVAKSKAATKECGKYSKIASQVKNKCGKQSNISLVSPLHCYYYNTASKIWTIIILFTAGRFPPPRKKTPNLKICKWLSVIPVISVSLFRHAKTLQNCQHWVSKSKLSHRAWTHPSA